MGLRLAPRGWGSATRNLLDRTKLRARAQLLLGLVEWTISEADVRAVPLGYRDGPLRAIRRLENTVELGMAVESPTYYFDSEFLDDQVIAWTRLRLPWDSGILFEGLEIDVYQDWRGLDGLTLRAGGVDDPLLPDGTLSEVERAAVDREIRWISALSPEGRGVLARLQVDERLGAVRTGLIYRDGEDPDPPENHPGQFPSAGWRMSGFDEIPAGNYMITPEMYFPRAMEPGTEERWFDWIERRVEVTVHPLPGATGP